MTPKEEKIKQLTEQIEVWQGLIRNNENLQTELLAKGKSVEEIKYLVENNERMAGRIIDYAKKLAALEQPETVIIQQ
jgi:hypothetical protein